MENISEKIENKQTKACRGNTKMQKKTFKIVVIGVSAGGADALSQIITKLPASFPLPVAIVQHLHPEQGGYIAEHFDRLCHLNVEEVIDKTAIKRGNIYFAPPDYHLLVEDDSTFSLSVDERVCYSRPSIDVLFKSTADVYGASTLAIILTGANSDGTDGIEYIKDKGGTTIAQDPATAYSSIMPQSAIDTGKIDKVLTLTEISNILQVIVAAKNI
jgi:two-component system, chemotaxis family, protein-glutamate methylesterase/glutaminase